MLRGTRLQYLRRAWSSLFIYAIVGANVIGLFAIVGFGIGRSPLAYAILLFVNILLVVRLRAQQKLAERMTKHKRAKQSN
jgi:hypothetical protein